MAFRTYISEIIFPATVNKSVLNFFVSLKKEFHLVISRHFNLALRDYIKLIQLP